MPRATTGQSSFLSNSKQKQNGGTAGTRPNKKRQIVTVEEDPDSDFSQDYEGVDFDNESGISGLGLNQILTQLGPKIEAQLRAKKQKLDEDFKDIKIGLGKLMDMHQKFDEDRRKEMDDLKLESVAISERLSHIVQVHESNEDKHAKMILSINKSSEQNKKAIEECVKAQADIFQSFMTELEKLEEKQSKATDVLIRKCEGVLADIKGKVVKESMKAETEALVNAQFL